MKRSHRFFVVFALLLGISWLITRSSDPAAETTSVSGLSPETVAGARSDPPTAAPAREALPGPARPATASSQGGRARELHQVLPPERMEEAGRARLLLESARAAPGITYTSSPGEDEAGIPDEEDSFGVDSLHADKAILEMIENPRPDTLETMIGLLSEEAVDGELKQHILANFDPLFATPGALADFLAGIIEDERQPDDLRVDALRKMSDINLERAKTYREHANPEISGEVDLLERLEAWEALKPSR